MGDLSHKTLVLHIGLHKTATTYLQNKLSAGRIKLLEEGLLYPTAGEPKIDFSRTRQGAQSGHAVFTRPKIDQNEFTALKKQTSEGIKSVIVSSENFTSWKRNISPRQYLDRFKEYGRVIVVVVLRRQDRWIESYYKQIVDGFGDYETRSIDKFLADDGIHILDLYHRISKWRSAAGPGNFIPLCYDDFDTPDGIVDQVINIAEGSPALANEIRDIEAEKYGSIRDKHTLPLRMLNMAHLTDRESRTTIAKFIIENTPDFPATTLSESTYNVIRKFCTSGNERIEKEWFDGKSTGLRFSQFSTKSTPLPNQSINPVFAYHKFLEEALMIIDEAAAKERELAARIPKKQRLETTAA